MRSSIRNQAHSGNVACAGMGQIVIARAPHHLTSILGSCVGVILWHVRLRMAGLAHIMLPDSQGRPDAQTSPGKFADTAIATMIRQLEAEGALAAGMVAKIAGGAKMFNTNGPLNVGDTNIAAVQKALAEYRIRIAASDVGGTQGRRVTFDIRHGRLAIDSGNLPTVYI